MVSVMMFREQFERLKEVEEEKDLLIENLIAQVDELQKGLLEEQLHLEREQKITKLYQSEVRDAEIKLKNLKENVASSNFVSVLIDGDCMAFLGDLIKSGRQGGSEAVRRLRTKVCEYVSKELKLPSNIPICIRVYANVKGLASVYCYNKILDSADDLDMFVRGFNMGYPMGDFVDAGDGKECADSKLKAWFNHDMADVQCRAILFGGSADNGYARLLQPYVGDNQKSTRIVLIEGPPFAKELSAMKDKFLVTRFPDVFRNTKLVSRRVSFSTTPPSTPIPDAGRPSYAGAIATSVSLDAIRIENTHKPSSKPVLENSKGQRLDTIINPPRALVDVLRNKKQCNAYHIHGDCRFPKCSFIHGERLDAKEIQARRWIARQKPCPSGFQCRDEKCLDGHQCPDNTCKRAGTGCRFTIEMHNVDRT